MSADRTMQVPFREVVVDARIQRQLVRAWLRERARQTVTISVVASVLTIGFLTGGGFDLTSVVVGVVIIGTASVVSLVRRARRRHAIGVRIGCGTDDDVLRLVLDGVDRLVHLSRVRLLGVRGTVVRLRLLGTTMLLPRELFDDQDLAALAAGAPAPPPNAGVLRRAGHLRGGVMGSEDVADMRRLVWRLNAYRPLTTFIALVAAAAAVSIIVLDHALVGYLVLLGVAVVLLEPLGAVAHARRGIPAAGTVLVGDVEDDRWVVVTPTSLAAIQLSDLGHVDRYRSLVLLHWRRPVPHTSWPARLLSDSARDRLQVGN